jgi:hypothetical protein
MTYDLSGQQTSNVRLTLSSSASENYNTSDTCAPPFHFTAGLWWADVAVTAVVGGYATPQQGGKTIIIPLDRGSGALFGQKDIPANDGAGYTGFTSIQVFHDPPPVNPG